MLFMSFTSMDGALIRINLDQIVAIEAHNRQTGCRLTHANGWFEVKEDMDTIAKFMTAHEDVVHYEGPDEV